MTSNEAQQVLFDKPASLQAFARSLPPPMSLHKLLIIPLLAFTSGNLPAGVIISEFLADNASGLRDESGSREDWIELHNTGPEPENLGGWWLSDQASNPQKWRIPELTLGAGETLLIWASGKNLSNPGAPLHTNFSLAKGGEFLGLFRPDDLTGAPVEVQAFHPAFPPQATDISYGISFNRTTTSLVAQNQSGRFRILPNTTAGATLYSGGNYAIGQLGNGLPGGWNVSPTFDDSSWSSGATGLGYDTSGILNPWIATNIQTAMRNQNPSMHFRRTFNVPDPAVHQSYRLMIKYEDGFVAYLNGTEIARANFAGTPTYNSTAISALAGTIATAWNEFVIPSSLVIPGMNLLAIQGLNVTTGSSDFLLLPEIIASSGTSTGGEVYFSEPTPGALNGAGSAGPVIFAATPADPYVPRPLGTVGSPPMKVTIRTIRTRADVASVRAYYRSQWNAESFIALNDGGVFPDDVAGDGIFSGNLPTGAPSAGQMFRWRFEAVDALGEITRHPAYADPLNSPRYFGTVAKSSNLAFSKLPVLDWFVEGSPANGPTASAFRGSCYYLNRFYDNTGHQIHGQSTTSFAKKSYDFDSNTNFRFVWREGERPVKDLNLLTNYGDKTKTRNTLAQEVAAMAGTPYHFAFPIRVHLNGAFHGVMDLVEDGDDRMLDRNGLDGEGALYKMYDSLSNTSGGQKKTRQDENKEDLQQLITGLDPGTPLTTRRTYAYDAVNLPATVNYLATRAINSDRDHGHKNYYVYRDTNGSREWSPIIWDVDLSFGHDWNSGPGYFDDTIYHKNTIRHVQTEINRLYRIIAESPEFRAMYLRRLRTLMDDIFQPPGTVNGILESRMREIAASIDPDPANPSPVTDGDLDAARWGVWGRGLRPREETEYVIANHFPQRRAFLHDRNESTRQRFGVTSNTGDPIPDNPQLAFPGMVTIQSAEALPVSGNQAEEYLVIRNMGSEAVDLSGWKIDGGIRHTFAPGTVIPAGDGSGSLDYRGLLHVAKNTPAFRARTSGPSGGQRRFVQGNFSGQLSARGETLVLSTDSGQVIHQYVVPATPTPQQLHLRIAEIQYHPAAPDQAELASLPGIGANDFEFIELINIGPSTLDLTGAAFTQGIGFTFPAASIASGGRIILAKNPAAFAVRYPGITAAVFGPYTGQLDNSGERLELVDGVGEKILEFTYSPSWYPATDGSGRSLVHRDPAGTAYNNFGDPRGWAISGGPLGSPGASDASLAQEYRGWSHFHFTTQELNDPSVSGPYADPDGDGRNNATEYALGTDPGKADQPLLEFVWLDVAGTPLPALRFRRPANALDVGYELLTGTDLEDWQTTLAPEVQVQPLPGGLEEVIIASPAGAAGSRRFLRLRHTIQPF